MQLMPATAKALGVDPTNTDQNIRGGIKYLKQQLNTFNNLPELALAAYNAGPGAVKDYWEGTNKTGQNPLLRKNTVPWAGTGYRETKNYVSSIMGMYRGTPQELILEKLQEDKEENQQMLSEEDKLRIAITEYEKEREEKQRQALEKQVELETQKELLKGKGYSTVGIDQELERVRKDILFNYKNRYFTRR